MVMIRKLHKILLILVLFNSPLRGFGQIIADHRIVSEFEKIPEYYINEVKKMWLVYAGESHSYAIREGLRILGRQYPRFAVNARESGTPDPSTTLNLRVSSATWGDFSNPSGWIYNYGEEDWFTNRTAVTRTKAGISYCHNNNNTISAIGLGWCWDLQGLSLVEGLGSPDPVYGCRWYGVSKQGPEGDRGWGLDDSDYAITGNSVNLDTYLEVTQEYIDYCKSNSIPTRVFFTTGPVDAIYGEAGYGTFLKYERIRDYVEKSESAILFDYADILCHNNNGTSLTTTWNCHSYPRITSENLGTGDIGHIGSEGALKLAKAMWWMLARIAGWDGSSSSSVPVNSITVTGGTSISTSGGTLQLTATVLPSNATNKTVTWSITGGSSYASVNSSTGLVTAVANGTVTVRATANDGSGVYGTATVTISNQRIPVTSISISGGNAITTNGGTLQLTTTVLPSNATDKSVTWAITGGAAFATINNESGLLTAIANGTVTVRATAKDGSGVYGTITVNITGQSVQIIPVSSINVSGGTAITAPGGTLQLIATVLPSNATNKTVTWSITGGSAYGSVNSSTGLLTAVANGTVTIMATANDGSGVYGTATVTISNQRIPVTSITISGGNAITTNGGTLQLAVTVLPSNATTKTVTWSVSNGTGQATINESGLVRAVSNGTVTVKATANDGSGVSGSLSLTISNQFVSVKSISITVSKGTPVIDVDDGTLTLNANVSPANATNKSVKWSVTNGTGLATINSAGILSAVANGTVSVKATASDGSNVSATLVVTISNQINQVENITITSETGTASISDNSSTLQLRAVITPSYATNQEVVWSVENITGRASIDNSGLVTAVSNGLVTVRAVATDGSGIVGQMDISILLKPADPLMVIVGESDLKIPLDEICTDCRMSLYDLNGHLIAIKSVESNLTIFERKNLRSGLYLIVLDNKTGIIKTGKAIIGR